MNLYDIVRKLRSVLESDIRVSFAIVFGSLTKGTWGQNSDIDVAIYSKQRLSIDDKLDLLFKIAKGLNMNEDKIDIVFLDDLTPLELRFKIFREGVPVTIKDADIYKHYRDKSISMYLDFKVFRVKLGLVNKYLDKIKVD